MTHLIVLEQADVLASPAPALLGTVVVALTVHGLAKLDEARTRFGSLGVEVAIRIPSDAFYPAAPGAPIE